MKEKNYDWDKIRVLNTIHKMKVKLSIKERDVLMQTSFSQLKYYRGNLFFPLRGRYVLDWLMILERNGIKNINELIACEHDELLKIKRMTKTAIYTIEESLKVEGLFIGSYLHEFDKLLSSAQEVLG